MPTDPIALSPVPGVPLAHHLAAGATVDQIVHAWLDAQRGSARTRRAYADAVAGFRAALAAANLDLDGAPEALALAAQAWAGRGGVTPATYNQRLACVSSCYRYALRHGLLHGENPIARVQRQRVQAYGQAVPLTPVTIRCKLEAIDRSMPAGQRDHALLAVALQTGRRLAEIAALRWGDLRLHDDGRATLTFQRCKGGKTMRDTLPAPLTRTLLAWVQTFYGRRLGELAHDAPLWVSLATNGTGGKALSTRAIELICAARLGTGKAHVLRHTFARALEDAGAKVSEIQARLGHESLATTGRYLAALRADENPHADALAALFGLDE
jgi:site-specific recombinase XerD